MLLKLSARFLKPYAGLLVAVVVLQLIATLTGLLVPTLNARVIDEGVTRGDIGAIWRYGLIMLGVSVIQVICMILAVRFGAMAAMGFGRDVRSKLFGHVLSFSSREFNRFGAPSLITRNTNDVQQLQMLVVMTATIVVAAPLTMVGGVIMALREDPGLTILLVVVVPLLAVIMVLLVSRVGPLFRLMQTRIDTLNRVLREQITGIRVVRAFTREEHESQRFDKANAELTATALGVGRYMALIFPVVTLIMNASSVAVVWFGGQRIASGDLQVGQLMAFLVYLTQILMSVMMASFMLVIVPRAAVSADRIGEVLETVSSVAPPSKDVRPASAGGWVAFEGVSFTYPGADASVLEGVDLVAEPGRTTAIIGSTGAGKTTLLNLIPRLFDATDGRVLVDGFDVRDFPLEELWARIGLVPQQPYLFSGSVASNLRYGNPDATDDELWEALRVAQAEDFVRAMEGGLDAEIAQGGTNISGGQRQRLSIARALVKRPEIYLFDDSFSALDVATDARLRAALKPVTAESTMIVVAQRVATIRHADRIIVLENGQIVGRGRHDDLLATCPTYAEIVDSQLSIEEATA
ncbi:MAG: ABC transporter ATP-binding protein [Propionibacteriaceae bacterium]|nr:ABC transporter ATP-binding protein [Propionibacteriaceae bacterium]